MVSGLKFICLTIGLIVLLSVTVNKKTIFGHIYSVISPATLAAQSAGESIVSKSYDTARHYTLRLFDNSVPKVKDSVKSGLSASKRKAGEPEEFIKPDEKNELDQLIKKARH